MMEDSVEAATEEGVNSSERGGESSASLQQVPRAAEDAAEPGRASASDAPSSSTDPVRITQLQFV